MDNLYEGGKMRSRKKIVSGIILIVFLISLFAGYQNAYANGSQPLVETQWVEDNLGNTSVKLVHMAFLGEDDRKNYDEKHIPGAVYLGLGDLMGTMGNGSAAPDKAKFETVMGQLGINKDSHVVLYGSSPAANPFIPGAYWLMKYFGHAKVSIMNGSIDKWNKEGREITGKTTKITATNYKAEGGNESIRADAAYVLRNLKNQNVIIVDTRSADEYIGKEDRNKRKGHIPGAININFYPANRNNDGTYKSTNDLKAVYEAKGVTKDKEIITYCEGGLRASDTFLVLKDLLGYPKVKVYVGSWGEWGNRLDPEKYPMEK